MEKQSLIFGTIQIDVQRIESARDRLATGYKNRDKSIIATAATEIQAYVDSGFDDTEVYSERIDDYNGNDPTMLARQYICHVFLDRYCDDDKDPEYIRTGLKPHMRNWTKQIQLTLNF
jgi:hypothetical protein